MLDKYCLFNPKRNRTGESTPVALGVQYENVFFTATDNVRLHGWFVPGKEDMTLLWCHGSGSNVGDHVHAIRDFHRRLRVNLFIFDYRGYGVSEGNASEKGTYLDAEAAFSHLRSRSDVNPARIVFYGYSLGTGVAVEMAVRHQPHAVILESPFTSILAAAKLRLPGLFACVPFGALVQSRYDSLSKIKNIRSPLLVLHGDSDRAVPYELGRELFDAAKEPKRLYTIKRAGHDEGQLVGGDAYFAAINDFLDSLA